MTNARTLIVVILAGILVLSIAMILVRQPGETTTGVTRDSADLENAADAGSSSGAVDDKQGPGRLTSPPGDNSVTGRWGVPGEVSTAVSGAESQGSGTADPSAGNPRGADARADDPISGTSAEGADESPDRSAFPPAPGESDIGFLGEPPEATDWGSIGPAPEHSDAGVPLLPPVEADAGDIGPGELEDDTDDTPPEG